MGKTSGFEQVANDLTTFDSHIVILIDEQRFDEIKRSTIFAGSANSWRVSSGAVN